MRQGLGDLLLQSKMIHSGIAVFYSVPSAIGDQVDPGQRTARRPDHARDLDAADAMNSAWTSAT